MTSYCTCESRKELRSAFVAVGFFAKKWSWNEGLLRSKITIRASLHLYSDQRCDLRVLVELIGLQESSDSDFSSKDEGDMDFLLLELSFKPKKV